MKKNREIIKEYGGYFPIELTEIGEYYSDNKNTVRLNSGRTAILYAFKVGKYKKIYVPIYICESVINMLIKNNINYEVYNINDNFIPFNIKIKENEVILYVNYYGIISKDIIQNLAIKYNNNIIIDNTQAFFQEPILSVYNIYSCRKFFGVSDGAYLIKKNIEKIKLEIDVSYNRATFLLKSLEYGTNEAYIECLQNEQIIENSTMLSMSKLTQRILSSIDYEHIIKKRNQNFRHIHEKLYKINELNIKIDLKNIAMVYPFFKRCKGLREYLISEKIYVPQWWKFILNKTEANEFEKELSEFLLPLPIDQRYKEEDMDYIADTIINKA